MKREPDAFDKALPYFYIVGAIFGVMALWIHFMGIPNFENVDGMREFCLEIGGEPIEKHRSNYNQFLCGFQTDKGYFEYSPYQLDENSADFYNKTSEDYCLICWDDNACGSGHSAFIRTKIGCDYK